MKPYYSRTMDSHHPAEEDLPVPTLQDDMEKTRKALEIAYAGFDNALDQDMIDCYIFEINSLLKRYKHLHALAAAQSAPYTSVQTPSSPLGTLAGHVSG